jgi:hypothetical protein
MLELTDAIRKARAEISTFAGELDQLIDLNKMETMNG